MYHWYISCQPLQSGWLTTLLQCFYAVGWVSRPVKILCLKCRVIVVAIEMPGFVWRKPKTARPRYSKKLQLKATTCDVSDYAYRTAAETDASLDDSWRHSVTEQKQPVQWNVKSYTPIVILTNHCDNMLTVTCSAVNGWFHACYSDINHSLWSLTIQSRVAVMTLKRLVTCFYTFFEAVCRGRDSRPIRWKNATRKLATRNVRRRSKFSVRTCLVRCLVLCNVPISYVASVR